MALTPDQRAMLQLLLERRQSYEDIGSLLGLSAGEVRSRARAILTDLGGQDPDAQVGLTDYLLGQADPIGRADVARHLQGDAGSLELARNLSTQLQVLAPGAQLPDLPQSKGGATPPPASPAAAQPAQAPAQSSASPPAAGKSRPGRLHTLRARVGGGGSQSRIVAALVAGALVVVGIVLAVSGVFGGGKDSNSTSGSNASGDQVPVTLSAPNGGSAKGEAVFANTGGQTNQVAFRIVAEGLQPSKNAKQTYTIWLVIDEKHAYPLSPVAVDAKGKINATRPIPSIFTSTQAGVQVLSRFQSIRLGLVTTKELAALIQAAIKKKEPLVPYIGNTALQGTIPTQPASQTGATGSTGG